MLEIGQKTMWLDWNKKTTGYLVQACNCLLMHQGSIVGAPTGQANDSKDTGQGPTSCVTVS